MSRISDLRERYIKYNNGKVTYITYSKDYEFLLRIAEAAERLMMLDTILSISSMPLRRRWEKLKKALQGDKG